MIMKYSYFFHIIILYYMWIILLKEMVPIFIT